MELIASMPGIGRRIAERPGRLSYIAKWPGARAGHRIVYEVTKDQIYIVRVLHTAMQFLLYINEDDIQTD
jgi:plasmid stabilization system protein ParE